MWDFTTSSERNPNSALQDPLSQDLLPAWRPAAPEQHVDHMATLVQSGLQTQQLLQELARQNAETNQRIAAIPQGAPQQIAPTPAAAPASGVDWAALMEGRQPAATPAAPPAQAFPTVDAVRRVAQEAIVERDNQFQRMQQEAASYERHFKENFPELAPHYPMIRDRFALEMQVPGRSMRDSYINAVQYGKAMLPMLQTPVASPPSVPGGGSGAGGGEWMPGAAQAKDKQIVADLAGQRYEINRYINGVVPLVEYPDEYEARHLARYAAFRTDQNEVRRFRLHEDVLKEYPEMAATA